MQFKTISPDMPLAHVPNLFCDARLLELRAIARRVGTIKEERDARAPSMFRLSAIGHGRWEIREQSGNKAGLFRTRQDAIKYARTECPDGNFIIIADPTDLPADR
jgi:hypothetical protein